jgi:peroxin-2
MQQAWEQAWNNAQPVLFSIRDSLFLSTSPDSRIIRVGQLDSELLDQELVLLLQEPMNKALALVNVRERLLLFCIC